MVAASERPESPMPPEAPPTNRPFEKAVSEETWSFRAGDSVPPWLMRQTNCVLTFDRAALVVERDGSFDLYPAARMMADEVMILAEIMNRRQDVDVEHVRPITVHTSPRKEAR
jgi:hypothetical protein